MDLTAENAKVEVTKSLNIEFLRELANFPEETIRWAFREWRRKSKFWPAVSDIVEIIDFRRRLDRENAEFEKQERERAEIRAARKKGTLLELPEIMRRFVEIIDKPPLLEKIDLEEYGTKMSDADFADRREMLRQQKEALVKRSEGV